MRVLSLFSGIGGLDLAAEWAGMEVVAQCEIDPYCQSVLRRHWPHVRLFDDIRAVTADAISSEIGIITGGFPCQPVSHAGKRRGEADDRWLWPEMLRVIREIQPAWVVGENVAGLVSMGIDGCISDLEEAGYAVQAFIVPACAVNALHRRDRVFIVAHAQCGGQQRSGRDAQSISAETAENREADRTFDGSSKWERTAIRRMGDMAHGLPAWMAGGWEEPARLQQNDPGRANKLRALGNAVVPAQAYPIFRAIMDIHQC